MRRALLLAALLCGACFDARHLDGTPCSSDGACPSDQRCATDGLCHDPGWTAASVDDGGLDAEAPPDAPFDAQPDASIDAQPDASIDAQLDASIDAQPDASIDAQPDASIDAKIPVCGDGVPDPGEACDDGDLEDADGCDPDCSLSVVVQVTVGSGVSCVRFDTGVVRCWGWPGIGDSSTYAPSESAVRVPLGGPALQVAAGDFYACALIEGGDVRCWGSRTAVLGYGIGEPVGDDEELSSLPPVVTGAVQVSVGPSHACALLMGGAVRCWGESNYGELGYGTTETIGDDEAVTDDVPLGSPAVYVAAGGFHTCALLVGGAVRCWGYGPTGALGYGTPAGWIGDDEPPSAGSDVALGEPALAIAVGYVHSCALLAAGNVRCWGEGAQGALGYGNTDNVGDDEAPTTDVPIGGTATQIDAGWGRTCVRMSSGTARCWGDNSQGQLGYGHTDTIGDDETPADAGDIAVGAELMTVDTDEPGTCVLLVGNTVRCWGPLTWVGDDETPAEAGDLADVHFW